MAFSLPSDLSTSWVDDSSTIHGSDWNTIIAMGHAVKYALGTIGYNIKTTTVSASETTTSASYADLTTTTDSIVVPVGSSGSVLLIFGATVTNSGQNYCYVGVDISGANTTAASDSTCIQAPIGNAGVSKYVSNSLLLTGLTPGFTTFKLKYKVNTGTGTFANRKITAIPLPTTDGTHESGAFTLNPAISLGFGGSLENRPIYDSVGAGSAGLGTTRSYTHTVGADAKAVIVYINTSASAYGTTHATAPAPTVTFGGQAMTLLGRVYAFNDGSTWTWLCAYGLLNPPTGAQTVSATLANSYTAMNSVAYTDVVDWGAVTVKTASSTNPSITSPSATGRKVISGALAAYTQSMSSVTTNQRSIQNYSNGVSYGLAIGDGDGPYGNTIACTAATGSWGGLTVELIRTVPTYTVPTWVGTGVGFHHGANPGGSWIDTVPADANLALVWVTEQPSDQANTCTVTLGGTSMVEITGSPWTYDFTSGYMRLRCFALLNPSTGPNKTVAVTSNVSNYFHAQSVYYGGVTSLGAASFVRGVAATQPSISIPNSSSTHLYAQAFAFRPSGTDTFSAYSPSSRWRAVHSNDSDGYSQPLAVGDAYGNDGSLTVSATRSNTTNGWGGVAIDLSPAALPTPSTPTFVGLGAGRPHVSGNYSWTETVPANANCAILWVSSLGTSAVSATLGGTAMTAVQGNPFTYYSGNYSIQMFYLLNPSTGGGKTLSLTNANGNNVHAIMTYYGGVTTIGNPTNINNGAAATQPAISISNTATDHLYVNAFAFRPAAAWDAITGYDQNRRIDHPNYSYDTPIIVGDAAGNGGTLTFNGTRNNTSYEWGGLAVDLSPTARQANLNLSLTPTVSFAARSSEAVTFDSIGAGFVNQGATTASWSHTIGANAKALIVVATFYNNGLPSPTFTNAKVGNTELTLLGKFLNFTTGGWNTYTAYLGCLNPPTGTQTVQFTTGSAYVGANSFAYNNVSTIGTPVQVSTANVSQASTVNIVAATTSSDQMVLGSVSGYTTAYTGFSQNERYKTGSLYWIVGDSIGTNGNTTLTATCSASTLYGAGYIVLTK